MLNQPVRLMVEAEQRASDVRTAREPLVRARRTSAGWRSEPRRFLVVLGLLRMRTRDIDPWHASVQPYAYLTR